MKLPSILALTLAGLFALAAFASPTTRVSTEAVVGAHVSGYTFGCDGVTVHFAGFTANDATSSVNITVTTFATFTPNSTSGTASPLPDFDIFAPYDQPLTSDPVSVNVAASWSTGNNDDVPNSGAGHTEVNGAPSQGHCPAEVEPEGGHVNGYTFGCASVTVHFAGFTADEVQFGVNITVTQGDDFSAQSTHFDAGDTNPPDFDLVAPYDHPLTSDGVTMNVAASWNGGNNDADPIGNPGGGETVIEAAPTEGTCVPQGTDVDFHKECVDATPTDQPTFEVTITGTGSTTYDNTIELECGGVETVNLADGTYQVTEGEEEGWSKDYSLRGDCLGNGSLTIPVVDDSNSEVDCVVTNYALYELTVHKECIPNSPNSNFDIKITGPGYTGDQAVNLDCGDSSEPVLIDVQDPEGWLVSEPDVPDGWQDPPDFRGACDGGGQVFGNGGTSPADLHPGDSGTCVVSNVHLTPVDFHKECVDATPTDQPTFEVTITGTGSTEYENTIELDCGGVETVNLVDGTYQVTEGNEEGWSHDYSVRGDCLGNGSLTIPVVDDSNSEVDCVITNYALYELTIHKECLPDADTTFDIKVTGPGYTGDQTVEDIGCGDDRTVLIDVQDPEGWLVSEPNVPEGWQDPPNFRGACDGGGQVFGDGGTSPDDLHPGDSGTCVVSNVQTGLLIQKICDPNDDNGLFDFLVDGHVVAEDVPCGTTVGPFDFTPGSEHSVSETGANGASLEDVYNVTFGGDCNEQGQVTLNQEGTTLCTITNTLIIGSIRVTKNCLPGNGDGTFEISLYHSSELIGSHTFECGESFTFEHLLPGTYSALEQDITGDWELAGNHCVSVTVNGESPDKHCSIDNERPSGEVFPNDPTPTPPTSSAPVPTPNTSNTAGLARQPTGQTFADVRALPQTGTGHSESSGGWILWVAIVGVSLAFAAAARATLHWRKR